MYGFNEDEVFAIEVGDFGFPYVITKINNEKFSMMFDTGNMVGISITRENADKLGLSEVGQWTSVDASGSVRGSYGIFNAEEVVVFGEEVRNLEVFESRGNDFEGIVGPQQLLDKRFTLDYQNKFMGISGRKSSIHSEMSMFLLEENSQSPYMNAMPVIEGMVNGVKVLIQLDTGKSRTVIDERLVQQLNLESSKRGYIIESIKLGSFEFSVNDAKEGSFDGISQGYLKPIMIGLGSDIISQFVLTVDYQNRMVLIEK